MSTEFQARDIVVIVAETSRLRGLRCEVINGPHPGHTRGPEYYLKPLTDRGDTGDSQEFYYPASELLLLPANRDPDAVEAWLTRS